MATLIRESGKKEPVIPNGDFFTLQEITILIEDIVEPLFVGDYWLFHGKNSRITDRKFNNLATGLVGYELYGPVLLITDEELSPTFFFPKEIVEHFKNMGKNVQKKVQKKVDKQLDKEEKNLTPEEMEEAREKIMNDSYKNLFETKKTFQNIMNNFELFNDGINKIYVKDNFEDRLTAIENMLEYFTEIEEYEKCSKIKEFKDKLYNYYGK